MLSTKTKITNNKGCALNLRLLLKGVNGVKTDFLQPKKSITIDFNIWDRLPNRSKLAVDRMIKSKQISVSVEIISDNKVVTLDNGIINISEVPGEQVLVMKEKLSVPKSQDSTKKIDPTFRTTQDRNAIKGYKVVQGSPAISKLGFKEADKSEQTFDHSKALANNNDTRGFAEIADSKVDQLVNKNLANVIKVDAPGLFANGTTAMQAAEKQPSVQSNIEPQTNSEDTPPTAKINQMLQARDIDGLKDYLSVLYPDIKFTKKALKECLTAQDIKERFGLNDLL